MFITYLIDVYRVFNHLSVYSDFLSLSPLRLPVFGQLIIGYKLRLFRWHRPPSSIFVCVYGRLPSFIDVNFLARPSKVSGTFSLLPSVIGTFLISPVWTRTMGVTQKNLHTKIAFELFQQVWCSASPFFARSRSIEFSATPLKSRFREASF